MFALLFLVGPMAVLVGMRIGVTDSLEEVMPEQTAVVMPTERTEFTGDQGVELTLEWGESEKLYAPEWSGIVTAIRVTPPVELTSGDALVDIDNVTRLVAGTAKPFWRNLISGDRGEDVGMLQRLLADLGYYDGVVDEEFGLGVRAGVDALARSLGVSRPDGTFRYDWIVWLPESSFVIQTADLAVGRPPPTAGQPIAVGPMPLVAANYTTPDRLGQVDLGGWALTLGGVTVALDPNGTIPYEGLEDLASAIRPGSEQAGGRIHLLEPLEVSIVPASAVGANRAGLFCIWRPRSGDWEQIHVSVVGGEGETVNIIGGPALRETSEVLVNPGVVIEDPTCRSE